MKGANLEDPDLPPVVLYSRVHAEAPQDSCRSPPTPNHRVCGQKNDRHSFVFDLLLVSQLLSFWKRLWVSYEFPGDFVWASFWGCHTVWELSPSKMKAFKRSRKKKISRGGT